MPNQGEHGEFAPLPSTLKRSDQHAQDIYEATLEHAEDEYNGDQPRAHRVAWAAVKKQYQTEGNHWQKRNSPPG